MKGMANCLLVLSMFLVSCGLAGEPLPTLIAPAVFPTQTPAPTPTWDGHSDIETLVERVAGSYISPGSLYLEEEVYPDGRVRYVIDLSVIKPEEMSRLEMLQLAYALQHEFFFNFAEDDVMSLVLFLRASPDTIACVFGLGIGYLSVPAFLPEKQPPDLEKWFQELVTKEYYADLPGESESLLAFGNSPSPEPNCDIEEWQK